MCVERYFKSSNNEPVDFTDNFKFYFNNENIKRGIRRKELERLKSLITIDNIHRHIYIKIIDDLMNNWKTL